MSQVLSSQGKNAPSDPYPHYLVRLAASRIHNDFHEDGWFSVNSPCFVFSLTAVIVL